MKSINNSSFKNILDELHMQDPEPILKLLNVDYRPIGQNKYQLKVRSEKHASAYITLMHGLWRYKDFGTGNNGTIENIVMEVLDKNYKQALQLCLETFRLRNRVTNAQNQIKPICIQTNKNIPTSIVLETLDIATNQLALDYLFSRGILKIPPQFKLIRGQYFTKDNEPKKVFGVGILNDTCGADLHFMKKIGSLKTMNLGTKDISFYKSENVSKLAIFESKMDYAAAYQQIDFSTSHILIANSTTNVHKVINKIHELNSNLDITFFQQNDSQGCEFTRQIVQKTNLKRFDNIKYFDLENGLDINDLLLKNVKIKDRLQTYRQVATCDKHPKKNRR